MVKSKLISHDVIFNMDFEEFERLEKFNLLTKEIEQIQMNSKPSSTGQKESGGLTIKRNGTIERT